MIDEEERQGHEFMTIARDIVEVEKGVVSSYFSLTGSDGKSYDPPLVILRNAVIMIVEALLSVPMYFLGRRFPWIAKNRSKVLMISSLVLCIGLLGLVYLISR